MGTDRMLSRVIDLSPIGLVLVDLVLTLIILFLLLLLSKNFFRFLFPQRSIVLDMLTSDSLCIIENQLLDHRKTKLYKSPPDR